MSKAEFSLSIETIIIFLIVIGFAMVAIILIVNQKNAITGLLDLIRGL